jgi:hypothetical protein
VQVAQLAERNTTIAARSSALSATIEKPSCTRIAAATSATPKPAGAV